METGIIASIIKSIGPQFIISELFFLSFLSSERIISLRNKIKINLFLTGHLISIIIISILQSTIFDTLQWPVLGNLYMKGCEIILGFYILFKAVLYINPKIKITHILLKNRNNRIEPILFGFISGQIILLRFINSNVDLIKEINIFPHLILICFLLILIMSLPLYSLNKIKSPYFRTRNKWRKSLWVFSVYYLTIPFIF